MLIQEIVEEYLGKDKESSKGALVEIVGPAGSRVKIRHSGGEEILFLPNGRATVLVPAGLAEIFVPAGSGMRLTEGQKPKVFLPPGKRWEWRLEK